MNLKGRSHEQKCALNLPQSPVTQEFQGFWWLRPLHGAGSTPAPLPALLVWCSPLLRWHWASSLPPFPPWGQEWSCIGAVPLDSWCPLTPNPSIAPSPRTFFRQTSPFSQKTEVWNLVSNPQMLLLYTDSLGVSDHHLPSTSLSVLVFKCHQAHSFSHFLPSETFWLFHLLASKITCLYLLLLKTSAGFPIPFSKSWIGFLLGFSGGNQWRSKYVNSSVRQA